jgi:hypothetical protein
MDQMVDWLAPAVIGAVVAALGYVSKLVIGLWTQHKVARAERRAELLHLRSLLRAGRAVFETQHSQAAQLLGMLIERLPEETASARSAGREGTFSALYPKMNPEERELHSIIRSATEYGMQGINKELLDWVRADRTYRVVKHPRGSRRALAVALDDMEAHLLMWQAKYQAWIPNKPHHALVYMGDAQKHGPVFPQNLSELVEELVVGRPAT